MGEALPAPLYLFRKEHHDILCRLRQPVNYRPELVGAAVSDRLTVSEYMIVSYINRLERLSEAFLQSLRYFHPVPRTSEVIVVSYHVATKSISILLTIERSKQNQKPDFVIAAFALNAYEHALQREFFSKRYPGKLVDTEANYVERLISDIYPSLPLGQTLAGKNYH